MGRSLEFLVEGGSFFEGPRWFDGRWWVSDFYRHAVHTVTPTGHEELALEVEHQPSGLGWLPDGSLLVVSMRDQRLIRRATDRTTTTHADLSGLMTGHANDMVVDRRGRAFVGCFGFDLMNGADPAPGVLVRVDPDGSAQVVAEDLLFPNGSVITPDGSTLIVGETMGARYSAFTINADGSLCDRRIWAQLAPTPSLGGFVETLRQLEAAPDGCTLDAEGHLWAADAIGARCVRISPVDGIVDEIRAPTGLGFFACMLGGDDGRTLLICAAPDFNEHDRHDARDAFLLTTTVDVPHAGLP